MRQLAPGHQVKCHLPQAVFDAMEPVIRILARRHGFARTSSGRGTEQLVATRRAYCAPLVPGSA